MKKSIVILSLFVLACNAVAQDEKNPFNVGIKGGLNIATILKDGDPDFETEPLYGPYFGGFMTIPLGNSIALQPEVLYSQKGYKATGSFLGSSYDYRRIQHYIDVPVLLRLVPSYNFGIVIGPQYSFLTSTDTKFRNGSQSYQESVENENDNLRKNILGGVIGLEFLMDNNLSFSARYTVDFQVNNGDGTNETPEYKNQVIQLGLGFAF